jgi:hypothetical protein
MPADAPPRERLEVRMLVIYPSGGLIAPSE